MYICENPDGFVLLQSVFHVGLSGRVMRKETLSPELNVNWGILEEFFK